MTSTEKILTTGIAILVLLTAGATWLVLRGGGSSRAGSGPGNDDPQLAAEEPADPRPAVAPSSPRTSRSALVLPGQVPQAGPPRTGSPSTQAPSDPERPGASQAPGGSPGLQAPGIPGATPPRFNRVTRAMRLPRERTAEQPFLRPTGPNRLAAPRDSMVRQWRTRDAVGADRTSRVVPTKPGTFVDGPAPARQ